MLSKYQVAVSTAAQSPVGVSLIDVTEGNYFWLQTKGPVGIVAAATPAPYQPLACGTTGVVIAMVEGTTADALKVMVAYMGAETGVAAKAVPCFLTLE